MSRVRMVPREVQLRLDEPGDAELLALLRAQRDALTDEAWYDATDALKNVYRSLPRDLDLDVMDRVAKLRTQVRAERRPP